MNTDNNLDFYQEESSIDLKREILKYLKYWPWFVIAVVLALILSFLYLRYTPNVYQTTAKIKILDESGGLELPSTAFVFNRSNINLENEVEILKSYKILEKVVTKLNLTSKFYKEGRIVNGELAYLPFYYQERVHTDSFIPYNYRLKITTEGFEITNSLTEETQIIPNHSTIDIEHDFPFDIKIDDKDQISSLDGNQYLVELRDTKSKTLGLKNSINISTVGKSSHLLSLQINGESKEKSELILNTLIDEFNNDGIKDRQLVSQRTLDFIEERFLYLAKELDSIEIGKKDFKTSNNLVDLPTNSGISLTQRSKTDEELFRLENQLTLSKMVLDNVNISKNELLPSNIGIDNVSVNSLISEYNTIVLEKEKLISSAGENNPSIQLLVSKIKDLRININSSLQAYSNQLEVSLSKIKKRNQTYKSQVYQIPEKEMLLRSIERQQSIKESLYLLLLQKREEAAINLAITEPSLKVVEHALSGSQPISPKSNIIYAAALLLGLLIPFGVLYVMFMFDTKLHGKQDIEKLVSDIPVAAEIPRIKGENTIFSNPNDRSGLAEAFRILSANTNYILPNSDKGKVIFCTSTIKGEGKTFVSLNLSLALSSLNKKVLLIGSDLRNPQVHSYLNLNKEKAGLSNYLHDNTLDWRTMLVKGFEKHPNHHILLSGSIPPNPAHLLTNGRFEQLLEEAKQDFDYIIVDTAPTILVTDTLLISQFADATLYITRANYTEKNLIDHSIELHKKKKLKNMAYVINSVGAHKSYGYNYGYEYGYE